VVFLANDTLLQRPVVLKLLKRGAQTLEQVRATQLARGAAGLGDRSSQRLRDLRGGRDAAEAVEEAKAYIVMQYIPGKSLDKVIAEGPASAAGAFERDADRGWSRRRTAGDLSSRPEAGERDADRRWADQDSGLRLARQLKRDKVDFDPVETTGAGDAALAGATYTARGGTIAYMAPEQFVTGQSACRATSLRWG
jgi:hypothetical protein